MAKRDGQLSLGAFLLHTGHHVAAWRHPGASDSTGFSDFVHFARIAENAKFDAVFLADGVSARVHNVEAASRKAHSGFYPFEPITLLSALSAVTSRIGLVATASTSFSDPYNLARQFASLDHLSGGRAGWNLVTSADASAAYNFSRDAIIAHADRYKRAEEFVDVVTGLWDTSDDDAFVRDRKSGVYFHQEKVRRLDHRGAFFQVRGPLNIARPPQGHPVVVQAGSSEPGKELAARTAEAVFTAQQTLESSIAFYSDLKGRLAKYGRAADDMKILPGVFPVVGRTRQEAEEKFEQLQALLEPSVGLDMLAELAGVEEVRTLPVDALISQLPETEGGKSRRALFLELAARENLTLRQLYQRVAGARGHWQIVGTAAEIADELEERFINFGADGFNIMSPALPWGLSDFVELVVPELRRRGLFRNEYQGSTLREHLGLKRPSAQSAASAAAAE
ncbi:LLM class flavin-dependent oxidoreductase [Rhizobium tubonense]|uniref:Nitrilotriacetate monooxygenase n=1 Tax=Rhizobium tubonense TaxID=484088 RepID=A0A2W4EY40_9HYPH|nr:LLM class flavin-dependent oxidoreductase [Rhizobium tubonense]PZM14890.1 nitrilotriacetate monooxygenase [Rhizobium tubonense]